MNRRPLFTPAEGEEAAVVALLFIAWAIFFRPGLPWLLGVIAHG